MSPAAAPLRLPTADAQRSGRTGLQGGRVRGDRGTTGSGADIVEHDDFEEMQMLKWLFRARRVRGDVRAAQRGPEAVGRRAGRRGAHRLLRRLLR